MKVRQVIRLLEEDGWYLVVSRGSRRQFKHPTKPGRVTVAGHPGHDLAKYEEQHSEAGQAGKEGEVAVYRFLVVIERANDNYSAYAPDLPGRVTTGKTREEAERQVREAIEEHVRGLIEDNLPIPVSSASAGYMAVALP